MQREFGIEPRFLDENNQEEHFTQGVQPVDQSVGSDSFPGQSAEATGIATEEPSLGELMDTDDQPQLLLGSAGQDQLTARGVPHTSRRSVTAFGDSDAVMYVPILSLCFDIIGVYIEF